MYGLKELIKNSPYDEDKGYGFVIKTFDDLHLLAYLIIDYPTFINKFDMNDFVVKKIQTKKQFIIEFLIDSQFSVLEVYSDKNNTNRVINELSKITNDALEIDDVYFKTNDIVANLINNKIDFEIKNLRIKDFKINSSVNGSYFVNYVEKQTGLNLIEKYGTSIIYMGIIFPYNDLKITLGMHDTGSLRIFNNIDDYPDILPYLKNLFLNGDY